MAPANSSPGLRKPINVQLSVQRPRVLIDVEIRHVGNELLEQHAALNRSQDALTHVCWVCVFS
jgi:hypothetical protein